MILKLLLFMRRKKIGRHRHSDITIEITPDDIISLANHVGRLRDEITAMGLRIVEFIVACLIQGLSPLNECIKRQITSNDIIYLIGKRFYQL